MINAEKIVYYSITILLIATASSCGKEGISVSEEDQNSELSTLNSMEEENNITNVLEEHNRLLDSFEDSNLAYVQGDIILVDPEQSVLSNNDDSLDFAKKALTFLKGKIDIKENSKVVVQKDVESVTVIFENKLSAGVRGTIYSAKVVLSNEGDLINILGGV